jgi:hypothetical protein
MPKKNAFPVMKMLTARSLGASRGGGGGGMWVKIYKSPIQRWVA